MMRKAYLLTVLLVMLLYSASLAHGKAPLVIVVDLSGRVDYGAWLTAKKAVDTAQDLDADALIVIINTYGGYLDAADRIIAELGRCTCKVISWVPPGGKAVSAGTLIALAADELYVAPGSVLGACKPFPEEEKVVEYVKARLRSLAEGASEEALTELEKMVSENKAFTSGEIVRLGLASRAEGLEDVLRAEGLSDARVIRVSRGLTAEIAALVLDPGIAIMMLVIGVLLLILEVKAAGFQGWGALGGGLIAVSLYALNLVGPNLLALIFVLLGVFLVIVELKKPGIQVFGFAGVALLTLAVVISYLRQPYIDFLEYAPSVAAFTAVVAGFLLLTMTKALEAARLKKPSLEERLVGKVGVAKTEIAPNVPGVVHVDGEDWTAYSDEKINRGERVVVVAVKGLTLSVTKLKHEKAGGTAC